MADRLLAVDQLFGDIARTAAWNMAPATTRLDEFKKPSGDNQALDQVYRTWSGPAQTDAELNSLHAIDPKAQVGTRRRPQTHLGDIHRERVLIDLCEKLSQRETE